MDKVDFEDSKKQNTPILFLIEKKT
jgi:hypothetical protein